MVANGARIDGFELGYNRLPSPDGDVAVLGFRATRDIEPGETDGYSGRWVANRASRIATIPVGYADGYPRSAKDGTPIGSPFGLIPLAGKVSMDMITADITDQPQLNVGSPVTLWGAMPSIDRVASHCDTIGYELLTRITRRVPKLFYRK